MKIIAEPVRYKDLKPGYLVSFENQDLWNDTLTDWNEYKNLFLFLSHDPEHDPNDDLYRIKIVKDADSDDVDFEESEKRINKMADLLNKHGDE